MARLLDLFERIEKDGQWADIDADGCPETREQLCLQLEQARSSARVDIAIVPACRACHGSSSMTIHPSKDRVDELDAPQPDDNVSATFRKSSVRDLPASQQQAGHFILRERQ